MTTLTGQYRFRLEGELMVLQVQEQESRGLYDSYYKEPAWRDARIEDFEAQKLLRELGDGRKFRSCGGDVP